MSSNSEPLDFNNHFINHILFNAITDTGFLRRVRSKLSLDIFKSTEKKAIAEVIFNYFDEFKEAPQDHFFDIFQELSGTMDAKRYDRAMAVIKNLKELGASNPNFIAARIDQAVRHFRLEEASVEFAKKIKTKEYVEAKRIIMEALRTGEESSGAFNYFKDTDYIEERLQEDPIMMKFGAEEMDDALGGMNPPWLVTMMGATKVGKTWWLIDQAVNATLQGLNVLFISLEMNRKQIKARFDQTFHMLSSNKGEIVNREVMEKVGNDWIKQPRNVHTIYDINRIQQNNKSLQRMGAGKLYIQAFNRGRLNYMDIQGILDELLLTEGFVPHVVIVDYLGIMAPTAPNQTKKERIGENCLGLKELCGERNIICITGMQGNRSALTAKVLRSNMIADDIDTVFNSDLILAVCQTRKEEKQNRHRVFVANFRHGPQHMMFGIIRDLTIGQMYVGSFEVTEDDEQEGEARVAGETF